MSEQSEYQSEQSEQQEIVEGRAESPASDFVKLLDYLKTSRGFDFSGYKLSSLIRRVQKRMQQVGLHSYAEYIDHLEVHPDEFLPLFNTVLINVTGFFRDPQAWETLTREVLPRILESKGEDQPVRIWSAGCASGEEAYTLAIVLAEALGEQGLRQRVKIYATDVDEEALAQARQGSYSETQVADVPPEMLSRYFEKTSSEKTGVRYVFRQDLRRSLVFGRHDLVQDAAISRLDLLICRNTLMYLNSETQARILARFHFALNRQGYLFLGKAETLLSHNTSFRPEDLKARIFQRSPTADARERTLAFSLPRANEAQSITRPVRVREAAFDAGPVAQIAVDRRGHLALANEKARRLFRLASADVGRLLQDLEISYRPVELRSHIDTVWASRMSVVLKEIEWRPVGGEPQVLEIQVSPLLDGGGALLGAGISFLDQTLQSQLYKEVERTRQELETAYEELQSANEELETTNEELQSTDEELRGMNDQIQQRSNELRSVNTHLHSILSGLRAAVVVLNPSLQVEVWSPKAQELWGLRGDEVRGKPFLALDIGLPVEQLRQPIRECLASAGGAEVMLDGINRRGKPIRCQIVCTPLDNEPGASGVILLMEEVSREPEARAQA